MTTRAELGDESPLHQVQQGTKIDAEVSFAIPPFGIAPDSRMIFAHPHFDDVRKGLLNTILSDTGFGVVTGEVGSGKTTLLHRVIADLPPDFEVAMIMNTCLKPDELLLEIAGDLGMPENRESGRPELERRQLLRAIGDRLDANHGAGRKTVIIIDEAQHLSDETLELVRMLSNLKSEAGKGVRFLLFGQDQLRERLLRPELQAFASRIGAQYHLNPLTLAETEAYVRHRLVASRPVQPVTLSNKAVACLHRASSGLPRRINIVAGNALQICLTNHRREISTKDIVLAAKAMALPYDRRTRERKYSTAIAWILFVALTGFAARQYVVPPGLASAVPVLPAAAEVALVAAEPVSDGAADTFVGEMAVEPIAVLEEPLQPEPENPALPIVLAAPEVSTVRVRRLEGNMRGPDVTRLQLRLAELGYFKESPTDKFGRATQSALMAYQRDQRIPEYGAAGPRTFAALYETEAESRPLDAQ